MKIAKILSEHGNDFSAMMECEHCGHTEAAAMLRTQHAEIEWLKSIVEDCNPYLKDGEIPADRIRRDIRDNDALLSLLASEKKIGEHLAEKNAVLRDLLRDSLSLIRNIECGCWSPEGTANLRVRIDGALNGQGRYIPRDGQIYAETSRRADPKAQLGNLLAVIHRDGGQYLAAHGIEKACADAEEAVAKWIMMESSIDALIEQSARAERDACARVCDDFDVCDPEHIAYAIRARSEQ